MTAALDVRLSAGDRTELLASANASVSRHFPLEATKARTDDSPLARAAWQELCAEFDPVGLALPDSLGGSGLSFAHLAVAAQAVGALVTPVPFGVTAGFVVPLLAAVAPARLPDVLAGRQIVTFLDGAKGLAPWGNDADAALRAEPQGDRVLVSRMDAGSADISAHRGVDRTRPLAGWSVDAAGVEELGTLPAAQWSLIRSQARTLSAAESVGSARAALDRAVSYVAIREQFGKPVGSFQAVQQRAADLFGEVVSAAAAVDRAVETIEMSDVAAAERASLVALVRAVDADQLVARESLHLHGGIGFTWEHDAHLYLKRSLGDAQLHGGRPALLLELAGLLGNF